MAGWVNCGRAVPELRHERRVALETESKTQAQAQAQAQGKATYDGLSGFSHPSVIFSREHRAIDDDGRVTYTYQHSDLERAARHVALALLDAFRFWAAYYGAGFDVAQQRIDELGRSYERGLGHRRGAVRGGSRALVLDLRVSPSPAGAKNAHGLRSGRSPAVGRRGQRRSP